MVRQSKNLAYVSAETMSAVQARARVNRFLLSEVGSQFCAGQPEFEVLRETWCVPILLVTPGFVAGQVGAAMVQGRTREIESHTPTGEIYAAAERLRRRHHAAIKTAFLRARER
jgi:hypothetical protein